MEKVYKPMCYVAKKMYAAIMYESPTAKGTLDVKGLALVKGDSSQLTRTLQHDVINAIMRNPTDAWSVVEGMINDAIATIKQLDKSKLIKQSKLGSELCYKNPAAVVSLQVANKMKARGQEEPQAGDLVPFLVGVGTSTKIVDRADHPDHVVDVDYYYYIDRQIIKPLVRILDVLKTNWRDSVYY